MISDAKILIRSPFSEQYTITIESEVKGVDVHVTSTVQLRYDFHVLKVEHDKIEIRLVQLDNVLLEANNPMVREVAQVSQVFGRMYNELHLKLNHNGEILEVLNNDFILSKWKQTKMEMEKYIEENDDLKQAIVLNEAIFTNPEKIKIAAQANEFLRIYFGQIYGIDLPTKTSFKGTNIFNTTNMDWNLDINSSVSLPAAQNVQSLTISTLAQPRATIGGDFYKSAYGQFADKIDIKSLNTKLVQQETRIIEYRTGRLQEAEVSKTEIADEKKLYNKLKYILRSDAGIIIKNEEDKQQNPILAEKRSSKFRFFDTN